MVQACVIGTEADLRGLIKHAHVLYEQKEYVTPVIRHSQRERACPNGASMYLPRSYYVTRRLLIAMALSADQTSVEPHVTVCGRSLLTYLPR